MTQEQAIKVLVSAVNLAQQKGAYSLVDAKTIITAIEALGAKEEVEQK